jgi:hypothetical protein
MLEGTHRHGLVFHSLLVRVSTISKKQFIINKISLSDIHFSNYKGPHYPIKRSYYELLLTYSYYMSRIRNRFYYKGTATLKKEQGCARLAILSY